MQYVWFLKEDFNPEKFLNLAYFRPYWRDPNKGYVILNWGINYDGLHALVLGEESKYYYSGDFGNYKSQVLISETSVDRTIWH